MCNTKGNIFIWDLSCVNEYNYIFTELLKNKKGKFLAGNLLVQEKNRIFAAATPTAWLRS